MTDQELATENESITHMKQEITPPHIWTYHNDALLFLESQGFTHSSGIIKPPIVDLDYRHDLLTRSAINYLCNEHYWDYQT